MLRYYARADEMVLDLKLKGLSGRRGLMFVSYYGRSRAFIGNYRSWREFNSDGRIAEIASSLLSHETLHLTLNKISFSASAQLDELFGQSNYWERYAHGLGEVLESFGIDNHSVRDFKKDP